MPKSRLKPEIALPRIHNKFKLMKNKLGKNKWRTRGGSLELSGHRRVIGYIALKATGSREAYCHQTMENIIILLTTKKYKVRGCYAKEAHEDIN